MYSDIGKKLSQRCGIVDLMIDLGEAMANRDQGPMNMLGGGNPGHIPQVQEVWRQRLQEILSDATYCDRLLADYDGPLGSPSFRQAMAHCLQETYDWPVTSDHVAVTPGAQSAFFQLFALLGGASATGPDRKIVLPLLPEYIGYANQGLQSSVFRAYRPEIELMGDHQFKYRIDFPKLQLDDTVGAICLSRPTNPSGNVVTDQELRRLAELAQGHGIPLIVDNAYGAPFPDAVFTDIRPHWQPGMIHVFSLSKIGLPGTRTGIVVADPEVIDRIGAMTAVIGLANNNIGQAIVRPMLHSGELVRLSRQVVKPYYRQRATFARELIERYFGSHFPYRLHLSEGAFFLWLWLPELPITSRQLYERLKARHVLIVPGEYFFFGLEEAEEWPHRQQCIRITFSQDEQTLERGIQAMAEEIRRLHRSDVYARLGPERSM